MCGRFNLTSTPEQVKEAFNLPSLFDFEPSYNITPGCCDDYAGVLGGGTELDAGRALVLRF
jgi:hypothetical protein